MDEKAKGASFSLISSGHREEHGKLTSTLKCPGGYVGWVADINPDVRMKVCMANISGEFIDDLYLPFTGNIPLEYIFIKS